MKALREELKTAAKDRKTEINKRIKQLYDEAGNVVEFDRKALKDIILEEAAKRDYALNDIEALDLDEALDYIAFMPSANKYEALLNAIVKNRVLQMKFKGKSFVLSTEEGYQQIIPSTFEKETINIYWGSPESDVNTRELSNLAPRKFIYNNKEYGSVEHAYQTLKSGNFDNITYEAYSKIGGYGRKIKGKPVNKGFDNLQLMKDLVVESFRQNPNKAQLLKKYKNFTHTTNEVIDQAFLEGIKLAQSEVLKSVVVIEDLKDKDGIIYTDKWNGTLDPGHFEDANGNKLTGEELK